MKSIIYTNQPPHIKLIDKKEQDLKDGEVRLKVLAASLNHRDLWMTKGLYPGLQDGVTLGSCGVGELDGKRYLINPNINWGNDDAYPNHKTYQILGMPTDGTFAEYITTKKDRLLEAPNHLTDEEAASLPLAGLTAFRALMNKGEAKPESKVLISGVGGGVAQFAFQFALALGCKVYVTSSKQSKIDQAVSMGASGGILYTEENWHRQFVKSFGKVNVIIDSAAGKGYANLLQVCEASANIVNYGGTLGEARFNPQVLFWKELNLRGSTMGSDKEFKEMVDFVEKHQIKPIVDEVYDLSDFKKAFKKMDQGSQFGKIVLKIAD